MKRPMGRLKLDPVKLRKAKKAGWSTCYWDENLVLMRKGCRYLLSREKETTSKVLSVLCLQPPCTGRG